jgi:hypothetical protein
MNIIWERAAKQEISVALGTIALKRYLVQIFYRGHAKQVQCGRSWSQTLASAAISMRTCGQN